MPSRFGDANRHPQGFLLAAVIDGLFLACIPLFFFLRTYSEPLSAFGLSMRRFAVVSLSGTAVGIALSAAGFVYAQVLGWLGSYPENPYIDMFTESNSAGLRASAVFVVVLVAPIAEELFFRAFVFSVVRLVTSTKLAFAISSTLFALAHFSVEWFIVNWLFGAILALLLQRTGSLVAPVAGHMTLNAVGLVSTLVLGGGVEELR
jgi:membrane protease YdiL (CAAX protease family)